MMSKFQKVFVILCLSAVFLLTVYYIALRTLEHAFGFTFRFMTWDLFLLGVLSVTFFYLMWKTLYSHSYHYYLRSTSKLIAQNLSIATSISLSAGLISGLFQTREVMKEEFLFLTIGIVGFVLLHLAQYLWMRSLSRLGFFMKNVLIVGTPDPRFPLDSLFQDIGNTKVNLGNLYRKHGVWYFRTSEASPDPGDESICYNTHNLMLRLSVGEIIIFMGKNVSEDDLVDVVEFCMDNSIGYYLVPDLTSLPYRAPWNRMFSYIPIIERYATSRDSLTYISIKRLTDIFISSLALLVFLPAGLLLALLIKIEDRGPVFYVSTRVGKNGKPIRFFKFRSMVLDAEKRKAELLRFNERKEGPLFKMKNDPRITRIGQVLRKYSLDEIPQLWNVFRGDMSLIGPRPHLPNEVSEYTDRDYLRLECIPGVSCLPQIYGRNSLSFREWVDYDLEYRRNWSLALDFKIILKTLQVFLSPMFSRKGEGF